MSPAQPVLQITDLAKSFGPTRALAGVGIEVAPATVHALLGGNGSGKSSLVKILAGVYQADQGQIVLNGTVFAAPSYRAADGQRHGLRFVHQDLGLIETATIAENMAFTRGFPTAKMGKLSLGKIAWRPLHKRTAELLERFEIHASPRTPIARLRPADRTMVAIARALGDESTGDENTGDEEAGGAPAGGADQSAAVSRRLLILDEPTASLARHESEVLLAAIRRRAGLGQTIVLISHHLQEVLDIADTITVLRDGLVAGTIAAAEADEARIITMIAGRAVTMERNSGSAPVATEGGIAALEVANLHAGPLSGIDLTVRAGEIVGVTGLVGSGRSSLVRAIFGSLTRRAGTVTVHGTALPPGGPAAAMAAGIALVPEDRGADAAFMDHSVRENLSATVTSSYFRGWMNSGRESRDSRDLIERFGIKASGPSALLSSLSGGNQQKAILARWLRREPRVLLLDEPTQGVDVVSRADIYRLIRQAAAEGCAVLVASSDAEEIDLLCHRAVVLSAGRLVAELDRDQLNPDSLVALTHTAISSSAHGDSPLGAAS